MAKEEKEIKSSNAYSRRSKNKRKVAIIASVSAAVVAAGAGTGLYFVTKINKENQEKLEQAQQNKQVVITKIVLPTTFKTNYFTSDTNFKIDGLKITVEKSDGTKELVAVTEDMFSSFNSQAGQGKTATITYGGYTHNFTYNVYEPQVAEVSIVKNIRTVYHSMESKLDPAGGIIKVVLQDGTVFEEAIQQEWLQGWNNDSVPGTSYPYSIYLPAEYAVDPIRGEFTVEKAVAHSIKSINIETTDYWNTDSDFNLSGGTMSVQFQWGEPVLIPLTEAEITAFNNSLGENNSTITHTATITYSGVSATFDYQVKHQPYLAFNGLASGIGSIQTISGETIDLDDLAPETEVVLPAPAQTEKVEQEETKYFVGYASSVNAELPEYFADGSSYTVPNERTVLYPVYMSATTHALTFTEDAENYTVAYNGADLSATNGILVVPSKYEGKDVKVVDVTMYDATTTLLDKYISLCGENISYNTIAVFERNIASYQKTIDDYELLTKPTTEQTNAYNKACNDKTETERKLVNALSLSTEGAIASLTNVVIPYGVTEIKDNAFAFCGRLKSVTILDKTQAAVQPTAVVNVVNSFVNISAPVIVADEQDVPEYSLTKIGDKAFKGCLELTHFNFVSSVQSMGEAVFSGCTNLKQVTFEEGCKIDNVKAFAFTSTALEFVDMSNLTLATKLSAKAFEYCNELVTAILPGNLEYLGEYSFANCAKLLSVGTMEDLTDGMPEGSYAEKAMIPQTIKGEVNDNQSETTSDGYIHAPFAYSGSIKHIYIPKTLTQLGVHFARQCYALETVEFEDVTTLTKIWQYAFENCRNLKSVPAFTQNSLCLGEAVFKGCSSLSNVKLPKNLHGTLGWNEVTNYISKWLFSGCKSLNNIDIPQNVTKIDENAFENCGLTSIVLPEKLESVGKRSFWRNPYMTQIRINSAKLASNAELFQGAIGGVDEGIEGVEGENALSSLSQITFGENVKEVCFTKGDFMRARKDFTILFLSKEIVKFTSSTRPDADIAAGEMFLMAENLDIAATNDLKNANGEYSYKALIEETIDKTSKNDQKITRADWLEEQLENAKATWLAEDSNRTEDDWSTLKQYSVEGYDGEATAEIYYKYQLREQWKTENGLTYNIILL